MHPGDYEEPRDPHWQPAVTVREMLLDHDRRLDSLDIWRAEWRGALALVKLAFGTSILSAIVSILALVELMGRK